MGRRKAKPKLPDDVRQLDSGKYGLQFRVDGRRLSGHAILRTVPRSFDTLDEALEARKRVRDFLASTSDRHTTVRGFWERWTDPDDPRWGVKHSKRREDTYTIYASRTRAFVDAYGDRQIAAITPADVIRYRATGADSQLPTISLFFKDAIKDGLLAVNPAADAGREAKSNANKRRELEREERETPSRAVVDEMLTRATAPGYPRSFYGWLLTGVRTGLRGGELDGMQWEYLDGDVYRVRKQLHYRSGKLTAPKHNSFREILLPADVMAEIDAARERSIGSPFIWTNSFGDPWRGDARERWWHWCVDGGPTLRSIVGGATMYQATRHHWADYALNTLLMPVPMIAKLYGHRDGGTTLLAHYASPDNDRAIAELRRAHAAQPSDLSARRRRAA